MSQEYTLFDLPSRGTPTSWSLNPWKARLVLNYKNLPYKTQWVEYPDLASTFKSNGIPPNDSKVNPNAEYSSPALKHPDGHCTMDSLAIAHELEKAHPIPSLRLDDGSADRALAAIADLQKALSPVVLPRVPDLLLNPSSEEYFRRTRAKRFGMELTDFAKSDQAGETAWKNAEPALEKVKQLLYEDESGPYVAKEPGFADFVLAGAWRFYQRCEKDGDIFGRVMQFDESFSKHYEACKKWLERDD
ncbi:hypothetical protein DOTSEDRAFT_70488 [Dothistroma septosporum NZE10]|uniref:GST N-terminal domain-containing protein n=1 Tax=Dothistroma septosporum (strain NZE10 / CBS 128990) TaxID=675120 RepID=N1PSR6_DOTSN|nr:hypothetical protein DOTSEDRAFT_70488 [Dothistroma septosporum NZE10]